MSATIVVDKEKKERIEKLIKSFKEIDSCILPYQDQRKDLRKSYIDQGWLSKEEFDLVKKSYNLLKKKTNMDDLSTIYDIAKKEVPSE